MALDAFTAGAASGWSPSRPVRVMEEGSCAAALLNARAHEWARRGRHPEMVKGRHPGQRCRAGRAGASAVQQRKAASRQASVGVQQQSKKNASRKNILGKGARCSNPQQHRSSPCHAAPPPSLPPHLLLGFELLLLQLLDLARKHGLGRRRGVDARRLDGDHKVAAVLEEVLGVEAHDTRLRRVEDGAGGARAERAVQAEMTRPHLPSGQHPSPLRCRLMVGSKAAAPPALHPPSGAPGLAAPRRRTRRPPWAPACGTSGGAARPR